MPMTRHFTVSSRSGFTCRIRARSRPASVPFTLRLRNERSVTTPDCSITRRSLRGFVTTSTISTSDSPLLEPQGSVSFYIQEQIQVGKLQNDHEQLELAQRLDALLKELAETDASVLPAFQLTTDWFSDVRPKSLWGQINRFWNIQFHTLRTVHVSTPRGIYIFGAVGVGKSFLMDLFYEKLQQHLQQDSTIQKRQVRRAHFHEFMLDIHQRIHDYKKDHPKQDAIPAVALSLVQEARILCLDEFQVTDIADAAILKRLFTMLWTSGVGMVVVATSNRDPDALYEGGLNRSVFVPFIHTLKKNMSVVPMGGDKDYRRADRPDAADINGQYFPCYHWPSNGPETRDALEEIFQNSCGTTDSVEESIVQTTTTVPVRMGRHVTVPRSNDQCAWFDFEDLCHRPLGAADYLAICERYPVLMVDHVPQLNASRFNEARRFVTLIDAAYESRTKLILAAHVPLETLFMDFEATVETQDGDEEIAGEAIQEGPSGSDPSINTGVTAPVEEGIFVKGEGGSSSSAATTMIQTKDGQVEWSATGRIGVSLAQLSAVQEVSFSFQRAESRLYEMTNDKTWGRV